MAAFNTDTSRWIAVQSKNPVADGAFVYCVKTTQIYCRPICKARLARRANVVFAGNAADAEKLGFRSCKRCRPELSYHDPHADLVVRACETIRNRVQAGEKIPLRDLAAEAGMTESHFHRVFKGVLGITPKDYAKSLEPPASMTTGSSIASSGLHTPITDYEAVVENKDDFLASAWATRSTDFDISVDKSMDTTGGSQVSMDPLYHVDFTIQPWSSFYVLVAVADNSICAIDTADTYAELIAGVQNRYPVSSLNLVDWSPDTIATEDCHLLFESVMGALENPTGKTVNISPGALDMHSVTARSG